MPSDRSFKMMDHTFAGVRDGSGVWLKAEEKALLEKLDGKRSAEEIGRELGLDEHKLRYSLYRLQEEGLARVAQRQPAPPPPLQIVAPGGVAGAWTKGAGSGRGAALEARSRGRARPRASSRPPSRGPGAEPTPESTRGRDPVSAIPECAPARQRSESSRNPRRVPEGRQAPPLALGRALAAGLVGLLVAAALWQSGKLFFPAPWQETDREVFTRTQRLAQFQKIDRAAHTHFLLAGHYPDDLGLLGGPRIARS